MGKGDGWAQHDLQGELASAPGDIEVGPSEHLSHAVVTAVDVERHVLVLETEEPADDAIVLPVGFALSGRQRADVLLVDDVTVSTRMRSRWGVRARHCPEGCPSRRGLGPRGDGASYRGHRLAEHAAQEDLHLPILQFALGPVWVTSRAARFGTRHRRSTPRSMHRRVRAAPAGSGHRRAPLPRAPRNHPSRGRGR